MARTLFALSLILTLMLSLSACRAVSVQVVDWTGQNHGPLDVCTKLVPTN